MVDCYFKLCYLKLKSCVYLHFWHADNSAVSASIETGLAESESYAFDDHRVYFYKPKEPTVHHQECVTDEAINHGQWFESHSTRFFYFS